VERRELDSKIEEQQKEQATEWSGGN